MSLRSRRVTIAAFTLTLAIAVSPAYANAGSAAAASWLVHLVLLNALFSAIEGFGMLAAGARWRILILAVIANVVSALLGLAFGPPILTLVQRLVGGDPVFNLFRASGITMAILIAVGMAVEFPLIVLAFGGPQRFRRAIWPFLLTNVVSAVIVVLHWGAVSNHSLVTSLQVASITDVASEHPGELPWIYYVDVSGTAVRRVRLNGSDDEEVCVAAKGEGQVYIIGCTCEDGIRRVVATGEGERAVQWLQNDEALELHVRLYPHTPVSSESFAAVSTWSNEFNRGIPFSGGSAADLRAETERIITVESSWSGHRGISISGLAGLDRLALDSGFLADSAAPRAVSVLPGDLIVFSVQEEFGPICRGTYVASLKTRRAARIADGGCPVVAYERAPLP